jgi:hypothetical protein
MFQKCPDVQRVQKIITHLQILKSGKGKAKGKKTSPSNVEIFHLKQREHAAPPFQKTFSSTAQSKVFRHTG